ncbi:hypothetical protein YTPLAS18_07130 [Nitrospira sp.]|nr:hypothetical protein YTPLAS18_07130 [Nitrospira sp.]
MAFSEAAGSADPEAKLGPAGCSKASSNKAAGSLATEAYALFGTSQGGR